jgi:SAM-dependent methyltransferase
MVRKMNIIKEKWGKRHDLNLAFWKGKLPFKARSFNHAFELPDYFSPMIGDKKEVWIADVGAGVISTTGNTWKTAKVHLYPSDFFWDEYKEFYKLWKIEQFIPMEKQDMENLTYKDEMFDIVHCANALDHCVDPYKALKEMYRVCKVGGWIYLRHIPDEGLKLRYSMQHQWNITKEGEDCLIWNYQDKFLLSDCVKGFKTIEKQELPGEPITIVSTLQK